MRTARGLLQLMAHRPITIDDGIGAGGIAIDDGSADGKPSVLAALNLACQTTTSVMEPASIKGSFRRFLLNRAPKTKMRFATAYWTSAGIPAPSNPSTGCGSNLRCTLIPFYRTVRSDECTIHLIHQ